MTIPVDKFLGYSTLEIMKCTVFQGCTCDEKDCAFCHGECYITLVPCTELWYPVRATDGKVYDAFALQHWLRCQRQGPFHVIPGCDIRGVEPMPTRIWPALRRPRTRDASTQTDVVEAPTVDNPRNMDAARPKQPPFVPPRVHSPQVTGNVASMANAMPSKLRTRARVYDRPRT